VERLLGMAQARGVKLGMAFLDGASIRAHQKAAGAATKAPLRCNGVRVRRLAALVAAMAPGAMWRGNGGAGVLIASRFVTTRSKQTVLSAAQIWPAD
jgi:hypothetical protein